MFLTYAQLFTGYSHHTESERRFHVAAVLFFQIIQNNYRNTRPVLSYIVSDSRLSSVTLPPRMFVHLPCCYYRL
jgi:hypothetical protein